MPLRCPGFQVGCRGRRALGVPVGMDSRQWFGNHSAGVRGGYAGARSGCIRRLSVMQTWKTVRDDLGCGFGGGLRSLLIRELFGGSLRLCGCCSQRQVMLGFGGQRGLCACDDEDLLELIQVGGRVKLNKGVGLMIGVWHY